MNGGYAYYCDNRGSTTCSGGGTARQTPLLDREVWAQVKTMLQDSQHIRNLYNEMVEGSRERFEGTASTLRAIEDRIAELNSSNDTLLARTEKLVIGRDDDVIAMYEQRMAANAKEMREHEARRAEVALTTQVQAEHSLTMQTFEAWARDVLPQLDTLPMQTKRILMRNLGVKVVLWRHEMKPRFLVLFGWEETLASFLRGDQRLHLFTTMDALEVMDGMEGTWPDFRTVLQERLDPVLACWARHVPVSIRTRTAWETPRG
ncbi:MAG TPA: hypothetical protein VJN88_12605, partial [Ktedonobacterales bacterium]|nr:hypothetical protein [Ktedonobacterales bacterium]